MNRLRLSRRILRIDNPIVISELERVAQAFDPNRSWVNAPDGSPYRLSQKVWQAGQESIDNIDTLLRHAVASGQDALKTARQLEAYLLPELAPIRDAKGRLIRDSATNQRREIVTATPGRGGRGSYAARRLARTEISAAHAAATIQAAELNPWVDELRYNVSANHPKADECDDFAHGGQDGDGVYPIRDCPSPPRHPHCRCYLTNVVRKTTEQVIAALRLQFGLAA